MAQPDPSDGAVGSLSLVSTVTIPDDWVVNRASGGGLTWAMWDEAGSRFAVIQFCSRVARIRTVEVLPFRAVLDVVVELDGCDGPLRVVAYGPRTTWAVVERQGTLEVFEIPGADLSPSDLSPSSLVDRSSAGGEVALLYEDRRGGFSAYIPCEPQALSVPLPLDEWPLRRGARIAPPSGGTALVYDQSDPSRAVEVSCAPATSASPCGRPSSNPVPPTSPFLRLLRPMRWSGGWVVALVDRHHAETSMYLWDRVECRWQPISGSIPITPLARHSTAPVVAALRQLPGAELVLYRVTEPKE